MINKLDSTGKTIPELDNFSLYDGNGIAQTLFSRKASHHRSCRQKITPMRIAQAEVHGGHKRKLDENSEPNKPLTRASLKGKRVFFSSLRLTSSQPSQSCFHSFCNICLISIDFLGIHVFSSSFISAVQVPN